MLNFRFGNESACLGLGAFMAVVLGGVAPTANADLVYSGVIEEELPCDNNGFFINIQTGEFGNGFDGAPTGWDVEIWGAAVNVFNFWGGFNGAEFMRQPGAFGGTNVANLVEGQTISIGGSFMPDGVANFGSSPGHWNYNSLNTFGFRFRNAQGQLRYGWMRLAVGSNCNARVLYDYAYEDGGGAIAAGVVPHPASALAFLLGARIARRRR